MTCIMINNNLVRVPHKIRHFFEKYTFPNKYKFSPNRLTFDIVVNSQHGDLYISDYDDYFIIMRNRKSYLYLNGFSV